MIENPGLTVGIPPARLRFQVIVANSTINKTWVNRNVADSIVTDTVSDITVVYVVTVTSCQLLSIVAPDDTATYRNRTIYSVT